MVSRLKQSFSFHASPETFISERQLQLLGKTSAGIEYGFSTLIVRAEILNRNVHIVSSYRLCQAIFETCSSSNRHSATENEDAHKINSGPDCSDQLPPDSFAAGPAYQELMEPFFPAPNLLMEDGPAHVEHKKVWRSKVKGLPSESVPLIRQMTQTHLIEPLRQQTQGSDLDLYDTLKRFSWDLLLGVFLGLDRRTDQAAFDQVETIQETVLQGQFSLFPVSVRMPFWSSARSRGLDGVRQLDPILNRHWDRMTAAADDSDPSTSRCPFLTTTASDDGTATDIDTASGASHLRLFTSSISNKAVASLLTAFFLNLFLWKCDGSTPQQHSLAEMIGRQSDPITRHSMLRSVLKETERLSPPVVGVMRRVQRDVSLPTDSENPGHFVPAGHDVWLYLVGANRDEAVFPRANDFVWDRFMNSDSSTSHGLTFGQGEKQCLGLSIVEDMCVEVASTVIEHNLGIAGAITERGVRQWLGWESGSDLAAIARDMKQLPCQRPRKPVLVEVVNITD